MGSSPVLLAAGAPRSRNYRAWQFPFRATGHFLYLVGRSLPRAVLWMADGRSELFLEPDDDDHAIWHGPTPGWDELASATGVDAVRPLSELPSVVRTGKGVATLPPQEHDTAFVLGELLGRTIRPNSGGSLVDGSPDTLLADSLIALRLHHDDAALDQMRYAAAATALAHAAAARAARSGRLEAEVRADMELGAAAMGCGMAYGPIVTVHGEVLHNDRQDGRLEKGALLLADVGAESPEGWAADVTRVYPIDGELDSRQRDVWGIVLEAQRAAISRVTPSVRYREVHHVARRKIVDGLCAIGILRGDPAELDARGAGDLFFPHGVGHLLGLDVHDMEDLGDRAGYARGRSRVTRFGEKYLRLDRDLEPGMAVTIEPGIYFIPAVFENDAIVGDLRGSIDAAVLAKYAPVRGIRLEDDVLVTESGRDVLTARIPIAPDEVVRASGDPA
jgi:Xaa-Pro aminopeptidase